MSTDTQYLTNEKFAELKKELEFLKSSRRAEVAEHLEYAKKLGDLSENAEYHQAREEQAGVEDRIRHLEQLFKNAVTTTASTGNVVTMGSNVKLQRNSDGTAVSYTIVGSEEADSTQGKVSNLSPLGSALIGRKAGDVINVKTPKGEVGYTIVKV